MRRFRQRIAAQHEQGAAVDALRLAHHGKSEIPGDKRLVAVADHLANHEARLGQAAEHAGVQRLDLATALDGVERVAKTGAVGVNAVDIVQRGRRQRSEPIKMAGKCRVHSPVTLCASQKYSR